jgi:hypothetical protein
MAKRGRKPKPSALKELEGNRGHRPILPDMLKALDKKKKSNDLEPPAELPPRQEQIWKEFINCIPWLTWADTYAALQWVRLAYKLEKDVKMTTLESRTFRVLSEAMGLNPSARAERIQVPTRDGRTEAVGKLDLLIGKDQVKK